MTSKYELSLPRGRPRRISRNLAAEAVRAFPHITTQRGRQNAIYAVWALDTLKNDPRFDWLCGDFVGCEMLRWSDFQDKHTWKPTILAALGRVGFRNHQATMQAMAAKLCTLRPSTREALRLIRQWQTGKTRGTVDGLATAIGRAIVGYLRRYPATPWTVVDEALRRAYSSDLGCDNQRMRSS